MTVRQYNRPSKVLLLTCVVNCTAGTPTPRLCPVVQWTTPGSESYDLGSSPGRGEVLCPLDMRGKKMRAPPLGLAKSIHYFTSLGEKPRVEEQVIIYLSERGMWRMSEGTAGRSVVANRV